MIVLVCGGRKFGVQVGDTEAVKALRRWARLVFGTTMAQLHERRPISTIVHGGASGADSLAGEWAEQHGIECVVHYANWKRHGHAAGPMRNQHMLDAEKPELVVAFPGGRGTADMVRRAKLAGVEVLEVD